MRTIFPIPILVLLDPVDSPSALLQEPRHKFSSVLLCLQEALSANGLLQALNTLYSREELRAALEKEE